MSTDIRPRGETADMAAVVARMPLARSMPASAVAQFAAGRAARAAGIVDNQVNDPRDAARKTRAIQARMREEALEKFLTDRRASCIAGLETLDPADQHPLELQAWLDDPQQSTLLLVGGTGTGKSQAAAALAAHAAQFGAMMRRRGGGQPQLRPLLVRGGPVNEYLRRLRPDGSPDPVWKIRDEARTAELWIGDDLGAEVDGELRRFAREEMADLLDYRLDANLRQVYTTNLSAEQLEIAVGDRMWSRLQQEATLIRFTGRDRRVRQAFSW